MWQQLMQNGDLFKDTYEGLYCVGCEEFKLPKDLVAGKCPDHNREPELLQEENYFFNLGKYTKVIMEKIISGELEIIPKSREHEILNILQAGFDRVSFSRPRRKLNWGVPVPGDADQVMYVWCDALTNYISALGYAEESEKYKQFWQQGEITHVIGKGILRFHAAIWPAMLLAAGLKLPNRLFVHGYITIEGKKMSKSLGNVVDPLALVEKYGADPLRYYLLKEIPSMGDGDFSEKRFKEIYNSDLTNGLGNLISRSTNMIANYLAGQVDWSVNTDFNWLRVGKYTKNLQYDKALTEIKKIIDQLNKMIDDAKPWQLAKSGKDEDIEKIKNILSVLAVSIRELSIYLKPYLPQTAIKIEKILLTEKIVKAEPLFPRLVN
jgi:methionyl-tRNA synthetase